MNKRIIEEINKNRALMGLEEQQLDSLAVLPQAAADSSSVQNQAAADSSSVQNQAAADSSSVQNQAAAEQSQALKKEKEVKAEDINLVFPNDRNWRYLKVDGGDWLAKKNNTTTWINLSKKVRDYQSSINKLNDAEKENKLTKE